MLAARLITAVHYLKFLSSPGDKVQVSCHGLRGALLSGPCPTDPVYPHACLSLPLLCSRLVLPPDVTRTPNTSLNSLRLHHLCRASWPSAPPLPQPGGPSCSFFGLPQHLFNFSIVELAIPGRNSVPVSLSHQTWSSLAAETVSLHYWSLHVQHNVWHEVGSLYLGWVRKFLMSLFHLSSYEASSPPWTAQSQAFCFPNSSVRFLTLTLNYYTP